MSSTTTKSFFSAQSCWRLPAFNLSSGKLQQQLSKGEFPLFQEIPIFESDFIQISKKGKVIDVHNSVQMVTVGIAATSPNLTIPDVMLLAQPTSGYAGSNKHSEDTYGKDDKSMRTLELIRLLPLKFVKLSIHNCEENQLHLQLITGRSFYLQLFPPSDVKEDLFAYWEDLVYLLRPPVEAYSGTQAEPAGDIEDLSPELEEEDESLAAMELHGIGDQDQPSIRSFPMFPELSGASSPAYAGGEGIQQQFSNTSYMEMDAHSSTESDKRPTSVTTKDSITLVVESEITSRPVSETNDCPQIEPLFSAWQTKGNTNE
ncbi:Golgi-associated RAB2 interactor protein 6-like [Erinaceus europaeus]|uniref:Golgi-associated RAB2 interactor protein 6-like n=1 Tax=Erinaceus europaeus TaxID=9365 RepID=A0A1S3AN81_ERIEU|nr:Golgi-associated RAB2 interactor protein 6-like [Erinaceus europaeus]